MGVVPIFYIKYTCLVSFWQPLAALAPRDNAHGMAVAVGEAAHGSDHPLFVQKNDGKGKGVPVGDKPDAKGTRARRLSYVGQVRDMPQAHYDLASRVGPFLC